MGWFSSHMAQILGITTLASEILGFTPVGGIVKGVASLVSVIAGALAGKSNG